jgi:hypothetical protein
VLGSSRDGVLERVVGENVVNEWLPRRLDRNANVLEPLGVERSTKVKHVVNRPLWPLVPQTDKVRLDAPAVSQALEPRDLVPASETYACGWERAWLRKCVVPARTTHACGWERVWLRMGYD